MVPVSSSAVQPSPCILAEVMEDGAVWMHAAGRDDCPRGRQSLFGVVPVLFAIRSPTHKL